MQPMRRSPMLFASVVLSFFGFAGAAEPSIPEPQISWMRTPGDGIQPQATVDAEGTTHLIYFRGEPAAGDIFYASRKAGEANFSVPIRVNNHPNSAVAMGTIRGAQLAVGGAGRVHVVWNGSKQAQPRVAGAEHDTPMLYARLNDTGDAFEPQRNLIQHAHGLDGGGSVAADKQGNVYVLWHANPAADGEANRRVYLATSRDDGQTFAPEVPISAPRTGVCGCCGMKAFVDSRGRLLVLYRSATDLVGRHMYLLSSDDSGRSFESQIVDAWEVARCPMSSAAFAERPVAPAVADKKLADEKLADEKLGNERVGGARDAGVLAAWETADRVYFGWDGGAGAILAKHTPGGAEAAHPAAAVNRLGEMILVWTEGTGWNRGGSVAWQVYDADGNATTARGSRKGVPTWSLATVFANSDGGFTIVY